jgi:hypothetical protein
VVPQPLPPQVTYQEFIVDAFQPAAYVPYGSHHYGTPALPPAYHSYPTGQLVHPTPFYAPAEMEPKRHTTVRSPVSGKFARTESVKRPLQVAKKIN